MVGNVYRSLTRLETLGVVVDSSTQVKLITDRRDGYAIRGPTNISGILSRVLR